LLAAQVTINGIATGLQLLYRAFKNLLTIVTGLGKDERSKSCSMIGGGNTEYFAKPSDLGWPSSISNMVRPKTDGDHAL
jgi:hypothetical protein